MSETIRGVVPPMTTPFDLQGCPGLHPRAPIPAASAEQRHAIDQALRALDAEVKRST